MPEKETGKSEKTKEHIFQTAVSLFQEKGYENTTMRDIAKKAKVAVGAAYYHFETKESIVMEFYKRTQEEAKLQNNSFCQKNKDFKERIKNVLEFKISQFDSYRNFVWVLSQRAGHPNHPLSPFSENTKEIREEAIGIFKIVLEDSNFNVPQDLNEKLPLVLWLYQMGIVYFWLSDNSKNQERTTEFIGKSLSVLVALLKISKTPFLKSIRKSALSLLEV
jgi:AcrR family transcriptional regulator